MANKWLKIFEGKLRATKGTDNFLYPDTYLIRYVWTNIQEAFSMARSHDVGRGVTWIEEAEHPARQMSGPWDYSPEAHKRHGLER